MPVFSTVYTGTCLYFRIIEFKSIFYHNKCVRYMSEGRNSKTGLFTSAKEVMFSPGLARLFVCEQDNSKNYGRILIKFSRYV